jgi:hypothetical protein
MLDDVLLAQHAPDDHIRTPGNARLALVEPQSNAGSTGCARTHGSDAKKERHADSMTEVVAYSHVNRGHGGREPFKRARFRQALQAVQQLLDLRVGNL